MIDLHLPWCAGLKDGVAMARFSTLANAQRWADQFGNHIYIWVELDEDT